jgi:hypothetical protein
MLLNRIEGYNFHCDLLLLVARYLKTLYQYQRQNNIKGIRNVKRNHLEENHTNLFPRNLI